MIIIIFFVASLFIPIFGDTSIPRFVTNPYAFFDICDLDDPLNASSISGIELNIVRDAFKLAGYVEGTDFVFECLGWPESLLAVYNGNATDNILGINSVMPINAGDLGNKHRFSQSLLQTGMGIGYFQTNSSVLGTVASLFFVRPFTASLYAMMLAMPVLFAIFLWFYEERNMSFLNYLFHLFVYYFKLDFLKKLNFESRIVEFIFQFYCAVIIVVYTSQMVIILSSLKTNGGVQSISDLRGLRIVADDTSVDYVSALYGRPIQLYEAVQLSSLDSFIYNLQLQDVPYFMFEDAIVEALAEADCRFSVVLKSVIKIDYAILWNDYTSLEMIEKMDVAIIEALDKRNETERVTEGVAAEIAKLGSNKCADPTSTGSQQILLSDVYALWIIWGICFGTAVLARLITFFSGKYRSSFLNFYDLEIRGPREDVLVEAVNSQTTFLAMVSIDMIQKLRQQTAQTYNDCFNVIHISPEVRQALLRVLEGDLDFNKMIEPTAELPIELEKPALFVNRRARKSVDERYSITLQSEKTSSIASHSRAPIHSQESPISTSQNHNSLAEMIHKARNSINNKTIALISGFGIQAKKLQTNGLQNVHFGSTHFKPREIAAYYDEKSFALDSDLHRLKEDSIEFSKLNDSHRRDSQRHHLLDQSLNNSIIKFVEPAEKLHYPAIGLKTGEVDAVDADELAAKEIHADHIVLEITPKLNEKNKGLKFLLKGFLSDKSYQEQS